MKPAFLFALFMFGHLTFADLGREGHGGITVFCDGQMPVTLDYFNASLPTVNGPRPDLLAVDGLSEDQTIELLKSKLTQLGFDDFKRQVEEGLKAVGPIDTWIASNLKDMEDSNEPYHLPPGCRPRTAAIRQNFGVMYGDPEVIAALSPAQRGLLRWHEAVYWHVNFVRIETRNESSEGVRVFMREFLKRNSAYQDLAKEIFRIHGNHTSWLDFIPYDGVVLEAHRWTMYYTEAEMHIDRNYKLHLSIDVPNRKIRLTWYYKGKPVDSTKDYALAHKDLINCKDSEGLYCDIDPANVPYPDKACIIKPKIRFSYDKSVYLEFRGYSKQNQSCPIANYYNVQLQLFHGTPEWQTPDGQF